MEAKPPSQDQQQQQSMLPQLTKKSRARPRERAYGHVALSELTAEQTARWSVPGLVRETPSPSTSVDDTDTVQRVAQLRLQAAERGDTSAGVGLRCGTCEVAAFASLDEQYAHFKSEAHCLNLKRRARGQASLSLEEAEARLTEKREGSDDSDGYSSSQSSSSSLSSQDESLAASEPVVAFTDGTSVFKVFKSVLPHVNEEHFDPHASLGELRDSKLRWAVLLLRSGRFAGAVFEREKALCHKTFQRYTTRRKQGGAQSASDASGKAKSAGATLRRYNEAALKQDVAALLVEWQDMLQNVELIFVGCSKTDRSTFFPDKKLVLRSDDPRLRRIPFATSRPTFQEVCRVRSELGSARFSPLAAEPTPSEKPKPKPKKPSKKTKAVAVEDAMKEGEEVAKEAVVPRLVQLVIDGDAAGVKQLLVTARDDAEMLDLDEMDATCMTALHHAAAKGAVSTVELLLQQGANPTLLDLHSRPPYFLSSSKEVRNVFRRFMAKHPDAWDYTVAQIPEGLTSEMEQRKKEKEAEKRRRARERKKQQKKQVAEDKRLEAVRQEELDRQTAAALACDFCGKFAGKSPFKRLEYKYCSTDCVTRHRRQLMSDAALKRLGG